MKTFYRALLATFALISFMNVQQASSKVWTIDASNYIFTPDTLLDVYVGDTIRWVWIEGSHTTTSKTIPDGAVSWDSPLKA